MIRFRVNSRFSRFLKQRLRRKAKKGSIRSLGHAGGALRLTARRSIHRSEEASRPGQPPHTRRGRLRESILYSVDKDRQRVIIGPVYSYIRRIGACHEFGGTESPRENSKKWNPNWKIRPGGHGPLVFDRKTVTGNIGRLRTPAQVARARRLAAEWKSAWNAKKQGGRRKYPARPFMGPALMKIRSRLPRMWASSVKA